MRTALLLLEIQNDYFANGKMPLENSLAASEKAKSILTIYRERKLPIFHIQHVATNPNATYLLPCTKGVAFHNNIQPCNDEIVIKKHYLNSFKDTPLQHYLRKNKIGHLAICGMMIHTTIDTTVRAACDLGFRCTVLSDACATKALQFNRTVINMHQVQYAFLASLQQHYAHILNVEEFAHQINLCLAETTAVA